MDMDSKTNKRDTLYTRHYTSVEDIEIERLQERLSAVRREKELLLGNPRIHELRAELEREEKELDMLKRQTGKGYSALSPGAEHHKRNRLKPHLSKMDQKDNILALGKIYELVENFISMREFVEKLQEIMADVCPNYIEVIRAAKHDLTRSDCEIVITGETSAGKTSLINLIVQHKKLFVTSNIAATGKVCRIRNSETMRLSLYEKDETLIKEETVHNIRTLKRVIRKYTDLNECPHEFKDVYFVDICLPVPLLQGNVIIVDTPGIGETEELDQILLDFLPRAVSFIIVVNAQNAGGIHEDRLLKILRKIIANKEKMPCFDPKDVLFLTNKWDAIDVESSDEEDTGNAEKKMTEQEKTWNTIQTKLKKGWGPVSDEKIFRLSLKQVEKGMQTEFTEEYTRFQRVLKETIDINKHKRFQFYFNFLENFIQSAERITLHQIKTFERSEEQKKNMNKRHREKIQEIEKECKLKRDILLEFKNDIKSALVDRLYAYLRSDYGKSEILSQQGTSDIMSVPSSELDKMIPKRIFEGIRKWCQGDEYKRVMEDKDVGDKIKSYVKAIQIQITDLETEMTGMQISFSYDPLNVKAVDVNLITLFELLYQIPITFFFLPPVVFHPYNFWFGFFVSKELVKKRIDLLYTQCLSTYDRSHLRDIFDDVFRVAYTKPVLLIFEEILPQQLIGLTKFNEALLKEQYEIRIKRDLFDKLAGVIKSISETTGDFWEKDFF